MGSLHFRMALLWIALFGILYAIITIIGVAIGITNFTFYLLLSLFFMFIQYMIGPKIVEWTMRVKYVSEQEAPELHQMISELSANAHIPKPKLGVTEIALPNAFAFGRSLRDGRVCVTRGIMRLLNKDELRAVLGHEISHLRNRDVLTITLLSVIPIVLYRIAWHLMFFGGGRSRNRGSASLALIGLAAFLFYFITNLLVLYASRIREYFADLGSVKLGNRPKHLATALYKLVYGSARTDKEDLRKMEGMKAFFLNDPSVALREIRELSQIDLDKSGSIDEDELLALRNKRVKIGFWEKGMELLTTHPNMVKRIQQLSQYEGAV